MPMCMTEKRLSVLFGGTESNVLQLDDIDGVTLLFFCAINLGPIA